MVEAAAAAGTQHTSDPLNLPPPPRLALTTTSGTPTFLGHRVGVQSIVGIAPPVQGLTSTAPSPHLPPWGPHLRLMKDGQFLLPLPLPSPLLFPPMPRSHQGHEACSHHQDCLGLHSGAQIRPPVKILSLQIFQVTPNRIIGMGPSINNNNNNKKVCVIIVLYLLECSPIQHTLGTSLKGTFLRMEPCQLPTIV